MHKLYEIKEKLMDELESYADNGKITPTAAEEIKVLSSAVDHICNICKDVEEDEYSMREGMPYNDGMGGRDNMSRRSYPRYSMARGRMNAPRDSRGRYSGADGDVEGIKRDVMELAEKVKMM